MKHAAAKKTTPDRLRRHRRHPWRGLAAIAVLGALAVAATAEASAEYAVQPGDTLSEIARDQGVSLDALSQANGIEDPHVIVAGTTLGLPVSASAPAGAASRQDVGALIHRTAVEHGWNPAFVKAVAWQESGWRNDVVSHADARGIMQVLPSTGRWVSGHLAERELDLSDPEDNVLAGVLFLDHLWELTDGDVEMTLAGYYQGLASVNENGMYDDTRRYIDNVLALRERF